MADEIISHEDENGENGGSGQGDANDRVSGGQSGMSGLGSGEGGEAGAGGEGGEAGAGGEGGEAGDMAGDDCSADEGIVATLDLQSLPEFNVEEDFVILSKEIFTALESDEGDGFSIEDEFAVVEKGAPDTTGAVIVFEAHNNTLYYDANGEDAGYGDDGGAIIEIAEIVGTTEGLTPADFFVLA